MPDLAKMSRRERAQLARALGAPPADLADWAAHRQTWPGPYRYPAGHAVPVFAQLHARAVMDARFLARHAPWRLFGILDDE